MVTLTGTHPFTYAASAIQVNMLLDSNCEAGTGGRDGMRSGFGTDIWFGACGAIRLRRMSDTSWISPTEESGK